MTAPTRMHRDHDGEGDKHRARKLTQEHCLYFGPAVRQEELPYVQPQRLYPFPQRRQLQSYIRGKVFECGAPLRKTSGQNIWKRAQDRARGRES